MRTFMVLAAVLTMCLNGILDAAAVDLQKGFETPLDSAKPQTWWHWWGAVTREGIAADLKAMKDAGLGGFQLFYSYPAAPADREEWHDMFRFAASEAARHGLEVGVMNGPDIDNSHGPWNTPENSMQVVVYTEANARGPSTFEAPLPKHWSFYRDIAVLAFPTPEAEMTDRPEVPSRATCSDEGTDPHKLLDGDNRTSVSVTAPGGYIQLEFERPYTARRLDLVVPQRVRCGGEVRVSNDGRRFRKVRDIAVGMAFLPGARASFSFEPTSGRCFRIALTRVSGGGKQKVIISEARLDPVPRIGELAVRAGYPVVRVAGYYTEPGGYVGMSSRHVVSSDRIVNLTGQLRADGRLAWKAPEGNWTILRIGYAPRSDAMEAQPSSQRPSDLECDKLSRDAADAHWAGLLGKLISDAKARGGKSPDNSLIDSWEAGGQNWTPAFVKEFKKRRGYDPIRYLPAFTGRVVDSQEVTERFFWDLRRTIADLFAENHYGRLTELAHENGMKFCAEAYGNGGFEDLQSGGRLDMPMGEFWHGAGATGWVRMAASAAHLYGRKYVGAEAFTTFTPAMVQNPMYPYAMKAQADAVYCAGINRFLFHSYVMQPWLDRFPGRSMGAFSYTFTRTNTWWEKGAPAFFKYCARCQYLLQQGLFVADAALLGDEGAPHSIYASFIINGNVTVPKGYAYDACNAEAVIERMSVKDGRLVLHDGMSYRVLVLPWAAEVDPKLLEQSARRYSEVWFQPYSLSAPPAVMTPRLLEKIRRLVREGATVVGAKPQSSPSLEDYPECDARVKALADEIWGKCDGTEVKENAFGRGRVIWGKRLDEIFAEKGLKPDFEFAGPETSNVLYIHKVAGNTDIYFVSNQKKAADEVECTFRVSGKVPELWHPDSGRTERAAVYREEGGRVTVPLRFDPAGSVFVVFQENAKGSDHIISAKHAPATQAPPSAAAAVSDLPAFEVTAAEGGKVEIKAWKSGRCELAMAGGKKITVDVEAVPAPVEIAGAWDVKFPPKWGAPEKVTLDKLISWAEHTDPGVKYFSGTAEYVKDFEVPAELLGAGKALCIDLGDVKCLAEVRVNGNDLGVLWKAPFRLDVTAVVHPRTNRLEVKVTNLWHNRMIGDERAAPGSVRYTYITSPYLTKDDKLLESGLLGPVMLVPVMRIGVP